MVELHEGGIQGYWLVYYFEHNILSRTFTSSIPSTSCSGTNSVVWE